MKVKCKNIYNEHTKQYQDSSIWITIGKEYIVLEVEMCPGKDILYRLVGDNPDESPALYDSRQFEVVSGRVPSNWTMGYLKNGRLTLSPEPWQHMNFWEKCYDGDETSLEVYKREARIIMEENG